MSAPDRITIPYEDFEYARFDRVGTLADGRQFVGFVTGAFPILYWSDPENHRRIHAEWEKHKRRYAVLHLFGADGTHLESEVWSGGTCADGEWKPASEPTRSWGSGWSGYPVPSQGVSR